jgi:6-phosphogluconate dehydrogenase
MIGLGKMGANMVRRLRSGGIEVTGLDRDVDTVAALAGECGMQAAENVDELLATLPSPRAAWLMLPAGDVTEDLVGELKEKLVAGDVLIDGANSNFNDSMRRAAELSARQIQYLDVGVSGGVWGLKQGYALMIGGTPEAVLQLQPVFETLAPSADSGWVHCGPAGSGHFVKMVHNGIEYGMMQAYAEGFNLLKSREDFSLDLAAISETWRHGSVVRSWLLDLIADFMAQDQELGAVESFVADSGEGRWTAIEAIEQGVPTPVMSLAVMMRFASQGNNDYASKMLAMMRKGFGGHAIKKPESS